jgi:hypothetical protein
LLAKLDSLSGEPLVPHALDIALAGATHALEGRSEHRGSPIAPAMIFGKEFS